MAANLRVGVIRITVGLWANCITGGYGSQHMGSGGR